MSFIKSILFFGLLASTTMACPVNAPTDPPVAKVPEATTNTGITWPPHGYSYQETVLRHHNVHRANHSAAPLEWGPNMLKSATKLAETCHYGHNTSINGGGYGQNIAAGTHPDYVSQIITNEMYNGEMTWFKTQYGLANINSDLFEHFGHFSQIVWKGTLRVACYTANCTSRGLFDASNGRNLADESVAPYFTVCNYWPPGNISPLWGQNVGRPLGHPSVNGQY